MTIYEVIEALLKAVLPQDCRIYQGNMPMQLMDQLQRETMRICTYLVFQDRIRMNSSGATTVHEIIVEFSLFGSLSDANDMANSVSELFIGQTVEVGGWHISLFPAPNVGKRDIWEPRVAVKREWLQFKGFAIEPDPEETSL